MNPEGQLDEPGGLSAPRARQTADGGRRGRIVGWVVNLRPEARGAADTRLTQ
jgi:hypothetical protein